MTKETKQDVFVALMADMSHGSEQWCARYDSASPCKLPVIPKSVGEYIKWGKTYGIPTYMMFSFKFVRSQGFSKLTDEVEDWIISNSDTFAIAWLLCDWEVEDEP